MTTEITACIIILITFLCLLFTYYLAIKIGFNMGAKADFNKVQMKEKSKPSTVYEPKPDPLDEEMLDYE